MGCWPSLNLWETIIAELSIVDASGCLMLLTYPIRTSGGRHSPHDSLLFVAQKIYEATIHIHSPVKLQKMIKSVVPLTFPACGYDVVLVWLELESLPSSASEWILGVNLRPSLGFLSDCGTQSDPPRGSCFMGQPWGNHGETHGLMWSCLVLVNTYTLEKNPEPRNASETNSNKQHQASSRRRSWLRRWWAISSQRSSDTFLLHQHHLDGGRVWNWTPNCQALRETTASSSGCIVICQRPGLHQMSEGVDRWPHKPKMSSMTWIYPMSLFVRVEPELNGELK